MHDPPGGSDVTVYESAAPPDDGGTTVTVACPSPTTTVVGAPGGPGAMVADGVTEADASDASDVPAPFVAVEVNVYEVPGVNPDTTHDVAGAVTVHVPAARLPASNAVTRYELGVPPPVAGVIVTVADPGPDTAVGAPGTPGASTTTALDGLDADDVPPTFVAVEVNVYDVPRVSPDTTHDVAGTVTVHEPPGDTAGTAVTVYDAGASADPDVGGVTVTVADVVDVTTTLGTPGAPGGDNGVTGADGPDDPDVPALFVAVEVNVYDCPFDRPETTHDVAGGVTVQVAPPGDADTRYDVGALPDEGATTVTVACPLPATTVGCPGDPGVVVTDTATAFDVIEPNAFVTTTRYCAPSSDEASAPVVYESLSVPTFTHDAPEDVARDSHWYDNTPAPDAVTENVAADPAFTDCPDG